MIDDPKARAGVLKGNPVHEDACEHAKKAGLDFIVNVTLDSKKRITRVFCGDPFEAHEKGSRVVDETCGMNLRKGSDIVITSNSGAPLDMNLYQTVKGIAHASSFANDKGAIMMASKCDKRDKESSEKLHMSLKDPEKIL